MNEATFFAAFARAWRTRYLRAASSGSHGPKRPRCKAVVDGELVRVQPRGMVQMGVEVPYPTPLYQKHPFKDRADLRSLGRARRWRAEGVSQRTKRSRKAVAQ